jgi:hypothetical protein
MSALLQSLHLAPRGDKASLSGLVCVQDANPSPASVAEEIARRGARLLEGRKEDKNIGIDYIFFRRFSDGRSSQVAAYVVDNSDERFTQTQVAELHRRVWLNGTAPLLYIEWPTHIDILKCAAEPIFWNNHTQGIEYTPSETLNVTSGVSQALDEAKVRRFSALRLSNGTFWENPDNADWACADKAAHQRLIQAVISADRALGGADDPLMRRLLLLSILAKYLEDRGVFPKDWFAKFHAGASSFMEVLATTSPKKVQQMLEALQTKFNGDIFDVPPGIEDSLSNPKLEKFVDLLEAKTIKKQLYLWKQYSFAYIPVEVLSHLYQHFAQSGKGAVFTPPFVADLMLDYALPYNKITGDERILDPTCGSGVFLVGAFRRLIHFWQSNNNWQRPGVPILKQILKKSIFGAELQPEAAHIAAFNLALAVCDALQPKVIWDHLKFDKLVGTNILVGDFFENIDAIRTISGNGFTTVIGNPPFLSKLTKAAETTRNSDKKKIPIPDGQMAYRVAEEAMELLVARGHMCLIQNAGFLYNSKARAFLKSFTTCYQINVILDFVSIRKLFEGADPKTVAILAEKIEPKQDHAITHLTFRRTLSVHERIGFELDHYDRHTVFQEIAETTPWVWKANLLGGGRLLSLGKKAKQHRNIIQHCGDKGWEYGEGFIAATSGNRKPAPWLTGKPCLDTKNLTVSGITGKLGIVEEKEFRSAYTEKRYSGPIIMIRANESLPCAYRRKGFMAFRDKIVGISGEEKDAQELRAFFDAFIDNRTLLRAFLYVFSTQMLIGKSTAALKRDIDELPSPVPDKFKTFSWWEKDLCSDVVLQMASFIRTGQNSLLLKNAAQSDDFRSYGQVLVKLLSSVYGNLRPGKFGNCNGLAYHAFYFGENSDLDWPDDWSEKLENVVFGKHLSTVQTARVIRYYDQNTLVIIKPDRLRHWIRSTAIRDADETLIDLHEQGF